MYEYKFDMMNCWYRKKCDKFNTSKCNANCLRYMEMDYLIKSSGLPQSKHFRHDLIPPNIDLNAFAFLNDLRNDIVNFVNNGENLYIFSDNFGNGKTSWSIKLMLQYFNKIWLGNGFATRGLFVHVPTFLTNYKNNISKKDEAFEDFRDKLLTVDIVIWDDIAANNLSDFDHANLLTYIDQRKLSGKSNIYTGNLSGEALNKALGNRLTSRIWNDSSVVELRGSDRRIENK